MKLEYSAFDILKFYDEFFYRLGTRPTYFMHKLSREEINWRLKKYTFEFGNGYHAYKIYVHLCIYDVYQEDKSVHISFHLYQEWPEYSGMPYSYKYRINDGHMLGYVNRLLQKILDMRDNEEFDMFQHRLEEDLWKSEMKKRINVIREVDV